MEILLQITIKELSRLEVIQRLSKKDEPKRSSSHPIFFTQDMSLEEWYRNIFRGCLTIDKLYDGLIKRCGVV